MPAVRLPTPQENLETVLRVLDELKADDATRFVTVLTGYAESDYRTDAVQRETVGVFQQNSKWWPSATKGTEAQCRAFVRDYLNNRARGAHNGDPVHDSWVTQQWLVPASNWPDPGPGWRASPETQNYVRRLPTIPRILSERRLP